MLRLEVSCMADDGKLRVLRQMILPVTQKLTVLTVAPHSVLSAARPDPAFLTRASTQSKNKALVEARELAEREATALDPSVETEAISRWGHPIEEILKAAGKARADLIVMAAKGHSNLHLVFMGSVSQGVAQHTTRPLLIARPGSQTVDRVLLGYHGTQSAKKALTFLNRLALPPNAEVVLFTAIEPFTLPEGMPPGYREQALAEAHKINERRHLLAGKALQILA